MKRYWSLCLKLTYRCTARCQHCSVFCAPGRTEQLPLELALKAVRQAAQEGFDVIWLSGGEVFLCFPELCQLVRAAEEAKLHVVVNSNGYWATSAGDARAMLTALRACGPFDLALSTDSFHMPFVGLGVVENAAIAARELGIPSWLGVVSFSGDRSLSAITGWADQLGLEVVVQSRSSMWAAPAASRICPRRRIRIRTGRASGISSRRSCRMVTWSSAAPGPPTVIPGSGSGTWSELTYPSLLAREAADPLYNLLRVRGPRFVSRLLERSAAGQESRRRLRCLSNCQLCLDLCRVPGLDEVIKAELGDDLVQKLVCMDLCLRRREADRLKDDARRPQNAVSAADLLARLAMESAVEA